MRLGILGGTFDPVHYGHLLLAESCRETCRLDQTWFLPAAVAPHKQQRVVAPAEARVEMLELALAGHEAFRVCRREIDRGGVTYTVDTLAQLREEDPSRELFFLMGADSLADFPTWREPGRICELATLAVVRRAGFPEPDLTPLRSFVSPESWERIRQQQVEMPFIGLASSDLRERAATGRSLRYRTPRAVEEYIRRRGLYR